MAGGFLRFFGGFGITIGILVLILGGLAAAGGYFWKEARKSDGDFKGSDEEKYANLTFTLGIAAAIVGAILVGGGALLRAFGWRRYERGIEKRVEQAHETARPPPQ